MSLCQRLVSSSALAARSLSKSNSAATLLTTGKRLITMSAPARSEATAKKDIDFRDVRYLDKQKQINPQPAIKLIHEVPPHEVDARSVWCNGGGGALGHPKIYINLDPAGPHACGYCGLRFIKKEGHGHGHGHH